MFATKNSCHSSESLENHKFEPPFRNANSAVLYVPNYEAAELHGVEVEITLGQSEEDLVEKIWRRSTGTKQELKQNSGNGTLLFVAFFSQTLRS